MREELDIVEQFRQEYDSIVRQLKSSKKYLMSNQTSEALRKGLQYLLIVVKNNRINELDNYMVYNTIMFSKYYCKICANYSSFNRQKWNLLAIKEALLNLKERGVTKEKYSTRAKF